MKGVIESFNSINSLPLVRWRLVKTYRDLEAYGFPCFLKVDVVGHKTEMGAVVKCNNLKEAEDNLRKMHKSFPKNSIIVQESFEGIEMIVGLKEDSVFGKLLVVGFGGIFAEVKKDVSFRALPVSRKDIVEMVRGLGGFGVFNSRKKYNLEKFYTLVEKVAHWSETKKIVEMDLNPVIVGEKDSRIVDVRLD